MSGRCSQDVEKLIFMWLVIWRVRCDTEKHWLVTSCCHTIAFSDLVDLWVIKMKKPMILCARSTSRSREQSTKRRSRSENMWMVCYFYGQNNKIAWLSNMADRSLEKFTRCTKVCGLFFLDCSFRMLIGWADKLQSRGSNERFTDKFCYSISSIRSILFRTLHFPPSSFSACLARALVCLILNFS